MPHRVIVRKVGLRGEAMLFLGSLWILVGLGTFVSPIERYDESLWHTFIPAPLRLFLWLCSGLWAMYSVHSHRTNQGLGVLTIMPILQSTSFFWGWFLYLIPGSPAGYPDGWYYTTLFILMLGAVIFVAHVPASAIEKKKIEKEDFGG